MRRSRREKTLLAAVLVLATTQASGVLTSTGWAGAARGAKRPAVRASVKRSAPSLGRRKIHPNFRPAGGRPVKVAFFDADATLRISRSGSPSANAPKDVRLLPHVARKIRQLNRRGYLVAIVSNQAGVPRFVSLETADAALAHTIDLIGKRGARIDYYDFAENKDDNRKPGTGMATRLEEILWSRYGLTVDRKRSFMVGDAAYKLGKGDEPGDTRPDGRPGSDFSNSDRLFAENLGITFFRAPEFFDQSNTTLKKRLRAGPGAQEK